MSEKVRSVSELAREYLQVISPGEVKSDRPLPTAERLIQAATLADEGKKRLLVGLDDEPGLRLPWDELDDKVRIAPGKFAIWTGYMHHGKSQILKQVMLGAMQQSERVVIASMEEEIIELWCDMARMACGTQEPSPSQLEPWIKFCSRLWFYNEQGHAKRLQIFEAIRYASRHLEINHFVIDSLMSTDIDKDDYNAQTRFARDLKALAKDEQITIHLVAHMRKRDGKSGDETVGNVQEIAGAHEISSLADYVFTVFRDKREREDRPRGAMDALLKVEKQRGRYNWIGQFGMNFHTGARQFVRGYEPMRFWDDLPGDPAVEF
jgi:archaellum biogenesis ATPase FlaH